MYVYEVILATVTFFMKFALTILKDLMLDCLVSVLISMSLTSKLMPNHTKGYVEYTIAANV